MLVDDLKKYWTLVQSHRRLNRETAWQALRLMARDTGKAGTLAAIYVANNQIEEEESSINQ